MAAIISDEFAQQLHDRLTRGGVISPDERAGLDVWLAIQDASENAALSHPGEGTAVADLRFQVNSALDQVSAVTRSIQQLTAENDLLRREIAALRSRLAAGSVPQPA